MLRTKYLQKMICQLNKNTVGIVYSFPCDTLPLPPMSLIFHSSPMFLELNDLQEVLDVLKTEGHLTAYYREDMENSVAIEFTQLTRFTVMAILQFLTDDQFNDYGGNWSFQLEIIGEILGEGMNCVVIVGNPDILDGYN